MSPLATSGIVFAFVFGGVLVGIFLRRSIPENHLNAESRTVLTMSQGIIGTMVAILLGLLIASAQSSYETQRNGLTELSAKVVLLDKILAHYGPEAKEARDSLRTTVHNALAYMWRHQANAVSASQSQTLTSEDVYDKILELRPTDEPQRTLKIQALNTALELGRTRLFMKAQGSSSISRPLLVVVVFWLVVLFASFGLFAPTNTTVISALLITALTVSGAIFLTLELYDPFQGMIQLSSTPLRGALEQLGQ
jgi:hypothetical protein